MERYDYTKNADIANHVLVEVEALDTRKRLEVHEAVKKINSNMETELAAQRVEWFDHVLLPILKKFAEITDSSLEIERNNEEIIMASIRNAFGFEITESCRCFSIVLLLAVQICVDLEEGGVVLVLTYDCRKFMP